MVHKSRLLPATAVAIEGGFWGPRLEINRTRTIPAIYRQLVETGRIDAFRLDWRPGKQPVPHRFWDSDVAKWIEAASYSLMSVPDSALSAQIDDIVKLIGSAVQPDSYLNTHYLVVEPESRWKNLRDNHELYCAGHLIEAAVAHYQATGKRDLLDPLLRYAAHIDRRFGPGEDQIQGYSGHQEIELALVKLYRLTGESRWLRLSKYFIDQRGCQPHYFDLEAIARGEDPASFRFGNYLYNQSHLPVRQQEEVVGHAVRAMYMYSAMTDLVYEFDDRSLLDTLDRLYENLVSRRLYITGGIGPTGDNEGFTRDFDLPNETAYAETCAAIGLVFWMQRMLTLEPEARYADLLEKALYNGVLSGVSLDGDKFYYENPLASDGAHQRQEWFSCACCPPNLARLFASLGSFIYTQSGDGIYLHLYIQSSARFEIAGQQLVLHQKTNYPWEGRVDLQLEMKEPIEFALRLRIPGWCSRYNLDGVSPSSTMQKGYVSIFKRWLPGDTFSLTFDMPVEQMVAHPLIEPNIGRTAIQRGPLIYCLEQTDNQTPINQVYLANPMNLVAKYDQNMLGGIILLKGDAFSVNLVGWDNQLYRKDALQFNQTAITAVPYFSWGNRDPGRMAVWLAQKPD